MSSLRESLSGLYATHGRLTDRLVVAAAEPQDHPLHDQFEWDDSVAGPEFRLVQAQRLIRSVKVRYGESESDDGHQVRRYHSVRSPDQPFTYMDVEDLATDDITSKIVLNEMEREWKQLARRYGHLKEFLQLVRSDLDDEIV